jgi:hypothetical protein
VSRPAGRLFLLSDVPEFVWAGSPAIGGTFRLDGAGPWTGRDAQCTGSFASYIEHETISGTAGTHRNNVFKNEYLPHVQGTRLVEGAHGIRG